MDNNKLEWLVNNGFIVGSRLSFLNCKYPGKYMVCENFGHEEVPTADGRNGPWCIVGDNLNYLIRIAYDAWYEEEIILNYHI